MLLASCDILIWREVALGGGGEMWTVASTGRWSEAVLAKPLLGILICKSAALGFTQIRSRANTGKKEGKVRRAGALPRWLFRL